ncbi:MAG: hypothetical protein AAF639_43225 [Chloroflexota bacterium]
MSELIIFVETSIQVRRFLADTTEQNELHQQFKRLSSQLYTTQYVWMEYQRTIVDDTAHIKKLMLTYDEWGVLLKNLLIGQRGFRARSAQRCTQIVGQLYTESGGDLKYAHILIDQLLRKRLKAQFWANVNLLPDSIICDLVTKGDIIIALQVPDGAAVWTLDSDFEPIVRSLGLTLHTY